jgi:SpoVK/Ycf46/Vps4 family AAA+-type ATPase
MKKRQVTPLGYDQYDVSRPGLFVPIISNNAVTNKITPGAYQCKLTDNGTIYLESFSITSDEIIKFENTSTNLIKEDIKKFWDPDTKRKYKEFNVVYKRGVLMYGKQGTGKTVTVVDVMDYVIENGGISLFNPSAELAAATIKLIREIEPELKILCVFEEFEKQSNDPAMLSLLDGELQTDNVVYLATTNYIDEVPSRIKNRPSRFANVVEIGPPDNLVRKQYLLAKTKHIENLNPDFIDYIVDNTSGFVIDQLKDVVISYFCMDVPIEECLAKIAEMEDADISSVKLTDKVKKSWKQIGHERKLREDLFSYSDDDDDNNGN